MSDIAPIFYGDVQVRYNDKGLICLTDMFSAAGSPENKDPRQWKRKSGQEFIDFVANNLNVPTGHIYQSSKGRGGATWAHWQIALAYAKYLSPEFHAWANQVVKERIEEDKNPELGISRSRERAIENWRKNGMSDIQIQMRLQGMEVRNQFTDTLKDHGVQGMGYPICTDNIYIGALGGTAKQLKQKRNLPSKANLRDNMSMVELTGTMFAEAMAAEKIEKEDRQGNNSCASACLTSGMIVKKSLDDHNRVKKEEPKSGAGDKLANRLEEIRNRKK